MHHPGLAVVTGAFGYTGGYVARRLIDQGVRVRTLTRRRAGGKPLGGMVAEAPMDFSDPDGLRRSMEGAAVLYNAYWIRYARALHLRPCGREHKDAVRGRRRGGRRQNSSLLGNEPLPPV